MADNPQSPNRRSSAPGRVGHRTGLQRITRTTLAVIKAVVDAGGDVHAWQLVQDLKCGRATVYGVLWRMEAEGWVEAWVEELPDGVAKPPRKFYRLTDTGATEAKQLLAERGR